ncbi:hypothetical protein EDI_137210 [Entamoeba dispar SAW760]|uniref:Uncharacterized protein n=1 Tax=Entamoeba dispar (strain ATCC PRA-260 / SAW760) TaxID=370354 RepID=B0EJ41_ENTDS|nr:uncharacterized protein EDI_137210 [Entamoeba dispar SAW760]EDR25457.1 hypothetical protein EDI_137210 [Entamoeba dispar SAW760]|eukprot:EDR25457.1 hypothetical protein EDI_137210 [Entamoeba dispar SAW760]
MQNTSSEISNDLSTPQIGLTNVTSITLDAQILKKKRMNYIKYNGTTNVPFLPPTGKLIIVIGSVSTTVQVNPSSSVPYGSYSLYAPSVISSMGHFELRFYTKFKQLKNK